MATVRGTFDLNSRPARSALRDITQDADAADASLVALGGTMDRIGSVRQIEGLRRYRRELGGLNRDLTETIALAQEAEDRLDSLGRQRATPTIDVRGIASAVGELEALEQRLDAIDRRRAVASVGVRGTAGAVTEAATVRAATSVSRGSGGNFGGLGGAFSRFPGAGPIPGGVFGLGALGVGLPAARGLVGGAGALLGSAYTGALGAGAVGLSGAGALGVGIGALASVAMPAATAIKAVTTEQTAYTRAVQQYGPNSKEARDAQQQLNEVMSQAPKGVKPLLDEFTRLRDFWQKQTAPAQQRFLGTAQAGLRTARTQIAPAVAPGVNRLSAAAASSSRDFFDVLGGNRSTSFMTAELNLLTGEADTTEHIAANLLLTFENLVRASNPYFRDFLHWVRTWTADWRTGTNDIASTRQEIGGLVDDTKLWGRVAGDTFDLLHDLLTTGAPAGDSMLKDFDQTLRRWDDFVNKHPRQVQDFFRQGVNDTEQLAGNIAHILNLLDRLAQMLRPLLHQFGNLANFAADLGPGGLPLLFSGYQGIKGGVRTAMNSPTATAAPGGVIPVPMGGGARAPRTMPRTTVAQAPFGAPMESTVAAESRLGLGGRLAAGGRAALSGFGRTYLPLTVAMSALQAGAFPGNFNDRFQAGLSGLSFGLVPMPLTPQQMSVKQSREVPDFVRAAIHGDPNTLSPAGLAAGPRERIRAVKDVLTDPNMDALTDAGRKAGLAYIKGYRQSMSSQEVNKVVTDATNMFALRQKRGESAAEAFKNTADDIMGEVKDLRGGMLRNAAQAASGWLKDLQQAHPKLRNEIRDTQQDMLAQLRKGADQWAIINGKIVKVNADSWDQIHKKITKESGLAAEDAQNNLQQLLDQTTKYLTQMGYTTSEARSIAQSTAHPGSQQAANQRRGMHGIGTGVSPAAGGGGKKAGGGRLRGSHVFGHQDHIPLPDGSLAAGDELFVNRHTESRVDKMLSPYGTNLDKEVRGEKRRHSAQPPPGAQHVLPSGARWDFAYGGRRYGGGGRYPGGMAEQAALAMAHQMGMSASGGPGTPGGVPSSGHVSDSLHYSGLAYDVSGSASQMRQYFLTAWRRFHGSINELFYDPMGYYYDQGHRVSGEIGGHSDHVHIGFFGGRNPVKGGALSARGVGAVQKMRALTALHTGMGGLQGALENRANDIVAKGMTDAVNKRLQRMGPGAMGGRVSGNAVRGKVSWFSGGTMASGLNTDTDPGIALNIDPGTDSGWNNPTTRKWLAARQPFLVQIAGHQAILPVTDMGPAGSTGRAIDVDLAGVRRMGFSPSNFPTDAVGTATPVRGGRGRALGGRARWGGWHADGLDTVVNQPTVFGAGEGHKPERVRIGPAAGGGGHTFNIRNEFHGLSVRSDHDIDKLAKAVGKKVASDLEDAINSSDGSGVLGVTGG